MDDFKWTVLLNSLLDKTSAFKALSHDLHTETLTREQIDTLLPLLTEMRETMFSILMLEEFWKLDKK